MHDEMLERRLQAALHGEADAMTMTITSAELERRFALRRRRGVSRMVTLLAAAGIGVGIVGAAGAAAGWFDRATLPPGPAPSTDAAIVGEASPPPSPSLRASAAPPTLPTLDALIAAGDPSTVVLAQAHGPDVGPAALSTSIALDPPSVQLALPPGHGTYEISFACISSGRMGYFVKDPARFGVLIKPDTLCDGSVTSKTFRDQGTLLSLTADAPQASWRVVVRRLSAPPGPIDGAAEPPVDPGQQEFVRITDHDVAAGSASGSAAPDGPSAPVQVANLPPRTGFNVGLSCSGAPSMRFVFLDQTTDPFVVDTETQVFCDGIVHRHRLSIAQPFGTNVVVTPVPGMTWQLVVSSDAPPIQVTEREPGWQLSTGLGPSLEFLDTKRGVSLYALDKRGPVRVVFTCAGSGIAKVTVDVASGVDASSETFDVDCPAEGGSAERTFTLEGGNVHLTYQVPARTWTAVSALVPAPSTAP